MTLDTSFDFRSDAGGLDPDTHSPTLRNYHQRLWSKPLPNGKMFDLVTTTPNAYLHHRSDLGQFFLASDSVIATLTGRAKRLTDQLNEGDRAEFHRVGYTIGGMMVFPGDRREGKMTLNGARGFHPRIADRLDLTLECIRRHYVGEPSPLGDTIARYSDFFALFDDFAGYAEFFHLQDFVSDDSSAVDFLHSFDDFTTPAVPATLDTYMEYRRRSIEKVKARNRRIDALEL
ncbi:MAG: hypothetical protein EOO27_23025 [Comamonadaceae bacterium]|nr:MAG: hypothetical protein EOO27_23025 [Comamonadaceae bacterium]